MSGKHVVVWLKEMISISLAKMFAVPSSPQTTIYNFMFIYFPLYLGMGFDFLLFTKNNNHTFIYLFKYLKQTSSAKEKK